jgi:hypothetical protein
MKSKHPIEPNRVVARHGRVREWEGYWRVQYFVGTVVLTFEAQHWDRDSTAIVICSGHLLFAEVFDTFPEARACIETLIPKVVERTMRLSEQLLAPIDFP